MTEPQNTKQELPREVFEAIRRIEDIGGSISAQAYAYRETVTDNLPLLAKDILRRSTTCRRREKCFAPSPRLPNKSDDILIEPLRKKYDSHRNDPRICLPSGAGKPLSGVARQCHERGHRRRRQEKDYRRHLPRAQQCRARQCGLSHDGQRDGILIQPLYREATALVKPVSTLCWQRKRIEPSAPRYGLFPNISVCLGERRGKKAISNSRERNVPAPALTQAH